jgi:putative hemolysin
MGTGDITTGLPGWVVWTAVCVLAAGSSVVSAVETALFSFQEHEVERLRREGGRFGDRLAAVLSRPRRLLGAVLSADVFFNVPLAVLLMGILWGSETGWREGVLAVGVLFIVVVFVCDLVPKLAALANPYRFIRVGVWVAELAMGVFGGVTEWLERRCDEVARIFVKGGRSRGAVLNDSELSTLIEMGAEEGALHPAEGMVVQNVLRLGGLTVRDCMVPRVEVFAIPDDLGEEEARERLREAGYRRVPVYGDSPDEVLGILDVPTFLGTSGMHYTELLMPPSFVPETMSALELLQAFLVRSQSMAVIVDEHGGTEGVVTERGLLEEVLGDAMPTGDGALHVEQSVEGVYRVAGRVRLEELEAEGVVLGAMEGVDTVGGWLFNRIGSVPRQGTRWRFCGWHFLIRRAGLRKIAEVEIRRMEGPEGEVSSGRKEGGR